MEKNRIKTITLLLVPVLLIAAVAGYYLYEDEQPIDVEEGYVEIDVEYRDGLVEGTDLTDKYYENKTSTAVSIVDENYTLELTILVHQSSIVGKTGEYQTIIYLYAVGNFSDSYDLDEFIFSVEGLGGENTIDNHVNFQLGTYEGNNTSFVGYDEPSKYQLGVRGDRKAFVTFDVEDGHFSVSTRLDILIGESNLVNPYTYRFGGTLTGLSEDVTSTIDLTFMEW